MKKSTKILIIAIPLVIACFLLYFFGREYIENYFFKTQLMNFPEPAPGQKVLVIAPHCDDETLGPGEFISRMNKKGVDFKIVLMTNGDGFTDALDIAFHEIRPKKEDYIRFGYLRQKETINAIKYLGLGEDDIIFLGYPDGGLYNMWSSEHYNEPYESIHTGVSKNPYNNSYSVNADYTGRDVVNDLISIISSYKPDYIFFPHPNDRHHDHLASYCFTKYVLTTLRYKVKEYVYLVHRGDWPVITPNYQNLYLVPPPTLANSPTDWYAFNLTQHEVQNRGEAIKKYASQVNAMGLRLMAFDRKNELFAYYKDGIIHKISDKNPDYRKYPMVSDPAGDVLLSRIHGSGDIMELYGYSTSDGGFNFYTIARSRILPDVKYAFDAVMFNDGMEQARISISVIDGSTFTSLLRGNAREEVKDINSSIHDNIVEIKIPGKYSAGVDKCFIGATSSALGVRLDNMAWRMYSIE